MILLDSNFAVMLTNTQTVKLEELSEIYGKAEFVTIAPVIKELSSLTRRTTPKRRRQFSNALTYLLTLRKLEGEFSTDADEALIEASEKNQIPVATLDQTLKARLRKRGIPVISQSAGEILVEGSITR
jgi:rRNA-processing protein FCF1